MRPLPSPECLSYKHAVRRWRDSLTAEIERVGVTAEGRREEAMTRAEIARIEKHTPAPWTRDGTLMSDHLEIDLRLDKKGENRVTLKGD